MASRRRLVSRTNQDATASSPAPRAQAPTSGPRTALPPYEPPAHPLTLSAKQKLANLVQDTDYGKYRKHLATSMTTLSNATADSNDALSIAKESLRRQVEQRRKREAQLKEEEDGDRQGRGKENVEKTEDEVVAEEQVRNLEAEVERLTREAEMAMRDLIDYSEELKMQDGLIRGVIEKAATSQARPGDPTTAAAAARARRRRAAAAADDSDYDSTADPDIDIPDADTPSDALSATELLKQARADATAQYAAKPLHARYGNNNDYQTFKKLVHDASHHGSDAPPLPPSSAWFAATEGQSADARRSNTRRGRAAADHTRNASDDGDDDDEDIVFAGEVSSLKCPLTLQTFQTPYSNRVCRHTFEKAALLEMFERGATVFYENSQARGRNRGAGVRKLMCPSAGCDAMLELGEFYEDEMVRRQVRRARAAEEGSGGEEEEEEEVLQGGGRGRGRRETMDVDVKVQGVEDGEEVQVAGTQM